MVVHERASTSAPDAPEPELRILTSNDAPAKAFAICFFEFFFIKEIAILIVETHFFISFRSSRTT
jgi:hypothetical protein